MLDPFVRALKPTTSPRSTRRPETTSAAVANCDATRIAGIDKVVEIVRDELAVRADDQIMSVRTEDEIHGPVGAGEDRRRERSPRVPLPRREDPRQVRASTRWSSGEKATLKTSSSCFIGGQSSRPRASPRHGRCHRGTRRRCVGRRD